MEALAAGVPNIGQTCWLSAAALLLSQLPPSLWTRVSSSSPELLQLLRQLHDARSHAGADSPTRPWTHRLLRAVTDANISAGFGARGQEHDPAELVEYVVSTLLTEDRNTRTVTRDLLSRTVCTVTRCQACSTVVATEDQPAYVMNVAVPETPVMLADCISQRHASEKVRGRCSSCRASPTMLLRTTYERALPKALIVLLRRTSDDRRKLRTLVKVPPVLTLVLRGDDERYTARFQLHGVVVHRGTDTQQGHYVYYGAGDTHWHEYDDVKVTSRVKLNSASIDHDAVLVLYLPTVRE